MMDVQAAVEFCEFDNSYARLPDRFLTRLRPTPVGAPRLVRLNTKLALDLGLDPERLATPEGVEMLAGNLVPQGGEPLAMAYAGHQFGTFVPQLGDGRAILLGEVIDRDWRAPRHPAQGVWPNAVFPAGRRTRGARACPARIHRQRGDGGARDSDDPSARRCDDRRAGLARDAFARRGTDSRRVEPHPCRHLPVLRGARGFGCDPAPR